MKNLPKDMSEIDSQKKDSKKEETKGEDNKAESGDEGEKKKKKKKKAEEEVEEDEPIELDSEETGKCIFYNDSMMNALSLPLIYLNDYNWFCNSDKYIFYMCPQITNAS